MIVRIRRILARIRVHMNVGEEINRRVKIENLLFDCASGKRPPPTPEECRKWAITLGTPEKKKEKQ